MVSEKRSYTRRAANKYARIATENQRENSRCVCNPFLHMTSSFSLFNLPGWLSFHTLFLSPKDNWKKVIANKILFSELKQSFVCLSFFPTVSLQRLFGTVITKKEFSTFLRYPIYTYIWKFTIKKERNEYYVNSTAGIFTDKINKKNDSDIFLLRLLLFLLTKYF